MTLEPLLEGKEKYVKFANNRTYKTDSEPTMQFGTCKQEMDFIMAFSQWAQEAANNYLIVIDLQGTVDRTIDRIDLTDPTIHRRDPVHFFPTNFSVKERRISSKIVFVTKFVTLYV